MHVYWNTATVIGNGNRAIDMDRDFDFGAVTGEMFIYLVIQNFEHTVV